MLKVKAGCTQHRLFIGLLVIVLTLIIYSQMVKWNLTIVSGIQFEMCTDVLNYMLVGKWHPRAYDEKELHEIKKFHYAVRQQLFLPHTLQRDDKLCGNVTFDEVVEQIHDLHWFRALCNPDGDMPCCYNNICVAKDAKDCLCDSCYDLRQPIHAELATWVPSDPRCKINPMTKVDDLCHLLDNMTIYIIGDSLLRHLYISLLTMIRSGKYYGPLLEYTSPGVVQMCNRDFVHLLMCMNQIDRDTWECNHSTKLKFLEYVKAEQSNFTLAAISELLDKPHSLVIVGIGIHDNFNFTLILTKLLHPLVKISSSSIWPRIVWSAAHSPGLMKSPRVTSQNTDSILQFNRLVRSTLQSSAVRIFDTFNLTKETVSFDGIHYGRGINDVKAQILLNYILELRK